MSSPISQDSVVTKNILKCFHSVAWCFYNITNSFQILLSVKSILILYRHLQYLVFAYDFMTQDNKVLCVHLYLKNDSLRHPRYFVEVYSVKNQCWRTIHNIFLVPLILCHRTYTMIKFHKRCYSQNSI